MFRRSPVEFFARFAENVLLSRLRSDKLVKPMMASLYVTVKCNFRCTYCDDGSGTMYPDIPEKERLETEQAKAVLTILRRASPGINVTGGEPTLRKDIDELYEHIDSLGFFPVTFNTNAFLLDKHLPLLRNLDYLIVSLDALDEARSDKLIDVGRGGQSRRVLANLALAQEYKRANRLPFSTIVSTVVMPETIDDAWDVFEYALRAGHFWNPMPHIVGKYPNPGLVDNPRWLALVDEVIRAKRAGARIYGSLRMLRTIRTFERYECYPTMRPMVYPNGDLLHPCGPLQTRAGNLLEIGDYARAVEIGIRKHGPVPFCDSRCHLGCFMEPSLAITDPADGILEALSHVRPRRPVRLRRPPRAGMEVPPALHTLRALPSLPPDEIRRLRRAGRIENDFSSMAALRRPPVKLPVLQHAVEHGHHGAHAHEPATR